MQHLCRIVVRLTILTLGPFIESKDHHFSPVCLALYAIADILPFLYCLLSHFGSSLLSMPCCSLIEGTPVITCRVHRHIIYSTVLVPELSPAELHCYIQVCVPFQLHFTGIQVTADVMNHLLRYVRIISHTAVVNAFFTSSVISVTHFCCDLSSTSLESLYCLDCPSAFTEPPIHCWIALLAFLFLFSADPHIIC